MPRHRDVPSRAMPGCEAGQLAGRQQQTPGKDPAALPATGQWPATPDTGRVPFAQTSRVALNLTSGQRSMARLRFTMLGAR